MFSRDDHLIFIITGYLNCLECPPLARKSDSTIFSLIMSFLFGSSPTFDPVKDIPNLSGKIILVTGGSNGLGKESIKQLAKHNPTKIYIGARSIQKAEEAILDIKKEVPSANILILKLEFASFSSIKSAADTFLAENDRLDILINNAGVFACPPGLTTEGYEIQFGTNYMGPALLTRLLLPILDKTASGNEDSGNDVRVVNVSSDAYQAARKGIPLSQVKTPLTEFNTITRYGQSKLANIYFTKSYAKRYPHIKSVAIHPGTVQTNAGASITANPILSFLFNLSTRVIAVNVSTGALNQLWASTASSVDVKSGAYYIPLMKEEDRADIMNDSDKAEELWQWTEREFEKHGF